MIDLTASDDEAKTNTVDLTADSEAPPPKKARAGKAKARRPSATDGDEAFARMLQAQEDAGRAPAAARPAPARAPGIERVDAPGGVLDCV